MEATFHQLRLQCMSINVFKLLSVLSFNLQNNHMRWATTSLFCSWKKQPFEDLTLVFKGAYLVNGRIQIQIQVFTTLLLHFQLSSYLPLPSVLPQCHRGRKALALGLSCKLAVGCEDIEVSDLSFATPSLFPVAFPESISVPPHLLWWWHHPGGQLSVELSWFSSCFSVMFSWLQ